MHAQLYLNPCMTIYMCMVIYSTVAMHTYLMDLFLVKIFFQVNSTQKSIYKKTLTCPFGNAIYEGAFKIKLDLTMTPDLFYYMSYHHLVFMDFFKVANFFEYVFFGGLLESRCNLRERCSRWINVLNEISRRPRYRLQILLLEV